MNATPLHEIEIYDLFVAAYPEIYADQEEGDSLWDRVMEHADDVFSDPAEAPDFLGRLVMLTNPMPSPLTGQLAHVLGTVKVVGRSVEMIAAVARNVENQA